MTLPICPRCNKQPMVPLSDFGPEGATMMYKAWTCIEAHCGYVIRIDKGEVIYANKTSAGARSGYRP